MSDNLKQILTVIALKRSSERATKRSKSHNYANHFAEALQHGLGIRIIEQANGNANYFCAEVSGSATAISPLASHDGWWEKPSDGFAQLRKRLGCRLGIVFLALSKSEVHGFWMAGPDFETELGHHTKIHGDHVERAERRGLARRFLDLGKFIEIIAK